MANPSTPLNALYDVVGIGYGHAGATLARWGVRGESLGGVLRFDALFEEFFRRGYAVEFDENFTAWPWDRVGRFDTPPPNEARNAAGWLWALWGRS